MDNYAAVKERLVAVRRPGAGRRGRPHAPRAIGRRLGADNGRGVMPVSAARELAVGLLRAAARALSSSRTTSRRTRPRSWATSPGSDRCAACTTRRTRPRPAARRGRRPGPATIAPRPDTFPGLAHRMETVGSGPCFRQRFQGDQRGRRRAGAGLLRRLFWIAGGRPKRGIASLANSFRASARPIWSARRRRISPGTLESVSCL